MHLQISPPREFQEAGVNPTPSRRPLAPPVGTLHYALPPQRMQPEAPKGLRLLAGPGGRPGCAGERPVGGVRDSGSSRLRFLGAPRGRGNGLGAPWKSCRRRVGECEGVRVPGRRFQEPPVALPKRPGRGHTEGIRSWEDLGGGGQMRGETRLTALPLLQEIPPARVHVGTTPCSARGPETRDSLEPPFRHL